DRNVTGVQTCALPILGQSTRARYNAHLPRLVNMARHNTYLAFFTGNNNTWAVRSDKPYPAFLYQVFFYEQHIHGRYAFSNTYDRSEERRVGKERRDRW